MPYIMIVDDQFTSRKILEQLVITLDEHLEVRSFADPISALEWAGNHQPDLVLTDYKMPQMDGIEFTSRLRELYADTPLVMVTTVEDKEVRYLALEAGATDFLNKPIDHTECRARCHNLLLLSHHQRIVKNRALLLESKVSEATKEIRIREEETLLRLAKAGEYRDEETGNHVIRMARFSRLMAEKIGLPESDCHIIEIAAPMHDIGKIGIPDGILLKPGKLDDTEMRVMRTHARIGYEILKDSPSKYLQLGAVIALGHHERYDGTGYPGRLRGYEIPLEARIVAVADVFDALTSVRPYKKAWSIQDSLNLLSSERGKHFDPDCVDAFHAQLEKILRVREMFIDLPEVNNG
ncbi:MAG: response regulator [Sulfuricaulis sp.]|nr:response regulator [Sulfuricaulis sp.]